AISISHIISLCYALAQAACPIALQNGDLGRAEHYTSMLLQNAEQNAQQYLPLGEGFNGLLLIRRGSLDAGLRLLIDLKAHDIRTVGWSDIVLKCESRVLFRGSLV